MASASDRPAIGTFRCGLKVQIILKAENFHFSHGE